jgi:hypothetical protein
MRELQAGVIGDRRVRLVVDGNGRYGVIIEVWGPDGWADISLHTDRDLDLHSASLCYLVRRTEQQTRAILWNQE